MRGTDRQARRKANYATDAVPVSIRKYGAKLGGNVTTNTTAINNALANEHSIVIPEGNWHVDSALDATSDYQILRGVGHYSKIYQDTDNTPILKAGGDKCTVRDLFLGYSTKQVLANTNANGIERII